VTDDTTRAPDLPPDPAQPSPGGTDPSDDVSGDTDAFDIVGPTGEEMPVQTHAEVHARLARATPPRAMPARPRGTRDT
jgi:hypothetical protein